MAETYYVRIRGKVLGPYEMEKLQSLFQRGQISRVHEVSTDSANWQKAAAFPEIFRPPVSAQRSMPISEESADRPEAESDRAAAPIATPVQTTGGPPSQTCWYYAVNDEKQGPVDEATLVEWLRTGQLSPTTKVWEDGMVDWASAESVPRLQAYIAAQPITAHAAAGQGHSAGHDDALSSTAIRPLLQSRGWVTFLIVVIYLYAGITFLNGLFVIVRGSKADDLAMVTAGLVAFVAAMIQVLGAILLQKHNQQAGRLMYSPNVHTLHECLDALKVFWMYVSIVLIVIFVSIGLLIIYVALAGAVTMPTF